MKEIQLTRGYVALVDDEDYEKAKSVKWYPVKGKNTFYAWGYDKSVKPQRALSLHRLVFGKPDNGYVIDHIDGNGLNNQKCNLRIASNSQNGANRKAWGKSKYLGVHKRKDQNRYEVRIAGKYVGFFSCETEAAKAYNKAAIEKYGEFAKLNEL